MSGHFYPRPPTFIGGRQPYAPKLGIAQSGPPSQPTRAIATLGIILASWAQTAPALPKRVQIAPLLTPASIPNPPYTRKQFAAIDAAWRDDSTTIISLPSVAPFADAPAAPDVAPIKGYKTVDLIRNQWKAREYLPPQPKGLAPLLPAAVVPDAAPQIYRATFGAIISQWSPKPYALPPQSRLAPLIPAQAAPDAPPVASLATLQLIIDQWITTFELPPQAGKVAALIPAQTSDAPPPVTLHNFSTVLQWWEREQDQLPLFPSLNYVVHAEVSIDVIEPPASRTIRVRMDTRK